MSVNYQNYLLGTCDEDLKYVMEEYQVTTKIKDESVERLRDWIRLQPHFAKEYFETPLLERFLGVNAYSMEKTKTKIENFCLARSEFPEFYENIDMNSVEMQQVFNTVHFAIMPQLTEQHYRISVVCIKDGDPDLFDCQNGLKLLCVVGDLKMLWDTTLGEHFIWDCKYTKFEHVIKMTPVLLKKALIIIQTCYGARIKGIHLINAPSYMNTVINILKLILKKKIADRIYTHESLEDLHKHFSLEYLPKELGGKGRSYTEMSDIWRKAMQSKEVADIYKYFDKLKADRTKMPPSTSNEIDDILGISGSFRKLEVD